MIYGNIIYRFKWFRTVLPKTKCKKFHIISITGERNDVVITYLRTSIFMKMTPIPCPLLVFYQHFLRDNPIQYLWMGSLRHWGIEC